MITAFIVRMQKSLINEDDFVRSVGIKNEIIIQTEEKLKRKHIKNGIKITINIYLLKNRKRNEQKNKELKQKHNTNMNGIQNGENQYYYSGNE